MHKILLWLIAACIIALCVIHKSYIEVNNKYETAVENLKAYKSELEDNSNDIRVYKLTLEQLKSSNDSMNKELISVTRSLKIKEKEIQSLSYNSSRAERTDTLVFSDTIFSEFTNVDTALCDKWYNLDLHLRYPDTIVVKPAFNSEKLVIIHTKKETIDPPKKFFLLRWFQKKHTVCVVDIVEKSPYITQKESRYIEIVK